MTKQRLSGGTFDAFQMNRAQRITKLSRPISHSSSAKLHKYSPAWLDIVHVCIRALSLSLLIRLGQMNPRNFVLFDRCERPALSPFPPQLKALTLATSNLLKFTIRRARLPHTRLCVINFILPFLSPPPVFFQRTITSSSSSCWLDRFVNANSKDRS